MMWKRSRVKESLLLPMNTFMKFFNQSLIQRYQYIMIGNLHPFPHRLSAPSGSALLKGLVHNLFGLFHAIRSGACGVGGSTCVQGEYVQSMKQAMVEAKANPCSPIKTQKDGGEVLLMYVRLLGFNAFQCCDDRLQTFYTSLALFYYCNQVIYLILVPIIL